MYNVIFQKSADVVQMCLQKKNCQGPTLLFWLEGFRLPFFLVHQDHGTSIRLDAQLNYSGDCHVDVTCTVGSLVSRLGFFRANFCVSKYVA